jgi:hypothetical protein
MNAVHTQVVCKNILKNNDTKVFTEEFTKKWVEIINVLEKNK